MHRSWTLLLLMPPIVAACGRSETDMGTAEARDMDVAANGLAGCYVADGSIEAAEQRPSPLRHITFTYGAGEALLCYGAPSARGRDVMSSLVPFGEPWRSGANEATALHLTAPATLGGVALLPGSYSLYTIPGDGSWEIFLSTSYQRWGIPIDTSVTEAVVGSFTVAPRVTDEMAETLTYAYEPNGDGGVGDIVLRWERTEVRFHFMPVASGG